MVMSIETYEAMVENAEMDSAISEAEAEFERDGQLYDAREALASLRRKENSDRGNGPLFPKQILN